MQNKFVTPRVYLIGYTNVDYKGLCDYLESTNNLDFYQDVINAKKSGMNDGEILCSFYAKLCYKSLTLTKVDDTNKNVNLNLTNIRNIPDNFVSTLGVGHTSVFEHVMLNFVITDCSRVFTHELVRHRIGTAFSQTSGRYVRGDNLQIIFDPILEPVKEEMLELLMIIEERYKNMVDKMGLPSLSFDQKKKMTSALRRILPNGQSNEIGFSVNLTSLRHIVQMRTGASAEWEIRVVFNQIYKLVKAKYPMIFVDAVEEWDVDTNGNKTGLFVVSGMKTRPY